MTDDCCQGCKAYVDSELRHLRELIAANEIARDKALEIARAQFEAKLADAKWVVGVVVTIINATIALVLFFSGRHP